jgi:DNA-binding transcriptional MerR regulator
MEKQSAIPKGFMTVGALAKKMNTTVRTLQYYDKEGILKPTAESEGGRRLYVDKDVIRLHEIQAMKHLGFSLSDIKKNLTTLDTPHEVAAVLSEQASDIRERIAALSDILGDIETLQTEILQMETVDWTKYADIVASLQIKNEFYGLIKHLDDDVRDHLRSNFDGEIGLEIIDSMSDLFDEFIRLEKEKVPPASERGQVAAREFWSLVTKITGGDMSLLSGFVKAAENKDALTDDWNEKWAAAESYLGSAVEIFFASLGTNPFEEYVQ